MDERALDLGVARLDRLDRVFVVVRTFNPLVRREWGRLRWCFCFKF